MLEGVSCVALWTSGAQHGLGVDDVTGVGCGEALQSSVLNLYRIVYCLQMLKVAQASCIIASDQP